MVTEVVPKRERPSFFSAAFFDDVHVIAVRPLARPMKDGAECVVHMRNVHISISHQRTPVRRKRLKGGNGHVGSDRAL
jgi:hypothetical protein